MRRQAREALRPGLRSGCDVREPPDESVLLRALRELARELRVVGSVGSLRAEERCDVRIREAVRLEGLADH